MVPSRDRKNYNISIYQDKAGDYRWRMVDRRNRLIVGASSEGYSLEANCADNLWVVTGWTADDEE